LSWEKITCKRIKVDEYYIEENMIILSTQLLVID